MQNQLKKVTHMKNTFLTVEKTKPCLPINGSNLKSPTKVKNDTDILKNYLDIDFKLDETMFDFYEENPKKLNRKTRFHILKFFFSFGFGS